MPKRHRPGASASSVLRHVEEVVLATSGEDAFEIVFAVAAARLARHARTPASLRGAIADVARRHPTLEVERLEGATDELVARVDDLLGRALDGGPGAPADRDRTLDAVFESLVPRIAKGDKGQFFTPRHVVGFIIDMLAVMPREVVVDPACGSGAFLAHARAVTGGDVAAHGRDVDARAVRVGRLLALASGGDPSTIARADGLRDPTIPVADVVATNPPFAGRAPADGFDVGALVRTPERDTLFLERSLALLRPGGRLGIVLPYNKASGEAFGALRRWLVERARVLAVVGLPRETFLPHTSQRTFVLFAQKRGARARPGSPDERTMFLVSERAGKDTAGEPILAGGVVDHDLAEVAAELRPFLGREVRA